MRRIKLFSIILLLTVSLLVVSVPDSGAVLLAADPGAVAELVIFVQYKVQDGQEETSLKEGEGEGGEPDAGEEAGEAQPDPEAAEAVSAPPVIKEAVKEPDMDDALSGSAELGGVATSGNTDTRSLTARLSLVHETESWRKGLKLYGYHSSDRELTTAERSSVEGKVDYKPSVLYIEESFFFLTARYVKDRFSGYDYEAVGVLGYGRKFEPTADTLLELEAGPGHRHRQLHKGPSHNEFIFRAAMKFKWQFTETSAFTEDLSVEAGDSGGAYTQAVTALSVAINSALSLRMTHSLRHNTQVPVGTHRTDTTTAVTLVCAF